MTTACRRDLACYRNDGHAGDHAYATPDTVPTPAPNWQAGYDAGYREAQEDAAMTTPQEDAIAVLDVKRLARAMHNGWEGEPCPDADCPDIARWLGDARNLAREYAALAAEAPEREDS